MAGRAAESSVHLDLYGLCVRVQGDWPEAQESVRLDFAWFESEECAEGPDVEIEIERKPPDFESFGDLPASFVTPRNVVYQRDGGTIVDYFGRAVSVLDRGSEHLQIQGDDLGLVHEAAYQFILSRAGIHLDQLGMVRLHGLGLAGPRGGAVLMLPSGGGKTTLALRAIEDAELRLLSEDTPLLDRRGMLHPFVLRIGVNESDAKRLQGKEARRLERMEFRPKLALEVETFADRIERRPQPLSDLIIGRRSLGAGPRLKRVPRGRAVGTMFREGVVGVGVYQGMEFVLQHGMRDTLGKAGIAASRAACCAAGLRRARVWELTVGRDEDRNWEALRGLLL